MRGRRPRGGVGSNQYQTRGHSQARAAEGRVRAFTEADILDFSGDLSDDQLFLACQAASWAPTGQALGRCPVEGPFGPHVHGTARLEGEFGYDLLVMANNGWPVDAWRIPSDCIDPPSLFASHENWVVSQVEWVSGSVDAPVTSDPGFEALRRVVDGRKPAGEGYDSAISGEDAARLQELADAHGIDLVWEDGCVVMAARREPLDTLYDLDAYRAFYRQHLPDRHADAAIAAIDEVAARSPSQLVTDWGFLVPRVTPEADTAAGLVQGGLVAGYPPSTTVSVILDDLGIGPEGRLARTPAIDAYRDLVQVRPTSGRPALPFRRWRGHRAKAPAFVPAGGRWSAGQPIEVAR